MKRVIVIGSGIIGASIAWRLTKEGAHVTVLDSQEAPGGVATAGSWAWINASWGNDREYVALRMRAMAGWREYDKQIPGLMVSWCGSLLWDLPDEKLAAYVKEHQSWGYPLRLVKGSEIAKLEPSLRDPPQSAVHAAQEASVEPVQVTRQILVASDNAGADVVSKAHVKFLDEEKGRVVGVTTNEGSLSADEVIVAAGLGSTGLLASVGLKLKLESPPGLLIHTQPLPEILNGLVLSPKLHVRQTPEGRLVAGSDFNGTDPGEDPAAAAEVMLSNLKALLKSDQEMTLDRFTVTNRPVLPDGIPAIGRPKEMPGLYLAVTHSGVTLAPVIGEIVANEILRGERDPSLARYHPDRHITQ
jgi:glycine/D-amino acid oxidase-like deaminating enzyme